MEVVEVLHRFRLAVCGSCVLILAACGGGSDTPAPNVVAPSPGVAAPTAVPSAPTMTNPPTVVVPGPPPSMAQGGSARPRKCWCYIVNPATNSRQRSTCEINCCKGGNQDERC